MPHLDHLTRHMARSGCDVVDIGAGDRAFAARLQNLGAQVTGVETDETKLANAREGVAMVLGRAEALPFPDARFDLAVFFFSLHHVPVSAHAAALAEATRVLRPGGRVHVVEPLPAGSMFELVKPIDDETEARHATQDLLNDMAKTDPRFKLIAREAYEIQRRYKDLSLFIERIVAVDPARTARLTSARPTLEAQFAQAPRDAEGRAVFTQPCVACHFKLV